MKTNQANKLCIVCTTPVNGSDLAVSCDSCEKWNHIMIHCGTKVSKELYDICVKNNIDLPFSWYKCLNISDAISQNSTLNISDETIIDAVSQETYHGDSTLNTSDETKLETFGLSTYLQDVYVIALSST